MSRKLLPSWWVPESPAFFVEKCHPKLMKNSPQELFNRNLSNIYDASQKPQGIGDRKFFQFQPLWGTKTSWFILFEAPERCCLNLLNTFPGFSRMIVRWCLPIIFSRFPGYFLHRPCLAFFPRGGLYELQKSALDLCQLYPRGRRNLQGNMEHQDVASG